MPKLLIGTSGYVYPHWRKGVFYPAGLPARRELEWYAERFPTVELNNPFYRLPEPGTVERWRDAVPPSFVFAFKASRFITHTLRLRDSAGPLEQLMARAALLGPKRGPVLFQLPPTFPLDLPRLDAFVARLDPDWRWVMEFRHPSWHQREVYDTLGRHAVALCIPIGGPVFPDLVVTAPFPAFPEYDAGPPVTEGAAIRVRGIDGSPEGSEERAHRPGQLASAPVTEERRR